MVVTVDISNNGLPIGNRTDLPNGMLIEPRQMLHMLMTLVTNNLLNSLCLSNRVSLA